VDSWASLAGDAKRQLEEKLTEAHMFYPAWKSVNDIVQQYQEGRDEDVQFLFAGGAYKSLKSAHLKIGKMSSTEGADELRNNFNEYHEKYEEKRLNWQVIPAESVAENIFHALIGNQVDTDFKVVDFGCGKDALFEFKLAQLVECRNVSGKVTVAAVDVAPCEEDIAETLKKDGGASSTGFVCESIVGDYSQLPGIMGEHRLQSFDAGVFCLSLMTKDALSVGLLAAARLVKPRGQIYVVLDIFKFGSRRWLKKEEQNKAVCAWCENLKSKTGFVVTDQKIVDGMVYLQMNNIGDDAIPALQATLQGLTIAELVKQRSSEGQEDGESGSETVEPSPKRQKTSSPDH